uniref:SAM domain-containing protein n=1 Tax=Ceratitis capitata TaxID=7213 RepID=W8BVI8_CERCA
MSELSSLKALLTSWGLPELFAQFQDESIDIEELKMMKSQHITEFLRSHKLGTRIRFEYHFERWRRDQNKPLTDPVMPNCTHTHYACSTPSHTTDLLRPEARESTVASNKNLQTRATNTAAVSYVSVATNTTAELTFKAPRLDKTPTPPPPPPPPPPLSIQLPPQPPPAPLPTISPKLSPPKVLPSAPLPPLSKPSSPTPLPAIKNSLREMPRRSVRQVSSSVLEVSGMVEIPKAFLLSPTTTTSTTGTTNSPSPTTTNRFSRTNCNSIISATNARVTFVFTRLGGGHIWRNAYSENEPGRQHEHTANAS